MKVRLKLKDVSRYSIDNKINDIVLGTNWCDKGYDCLVQCHGKNQELFFRNNEVEFIESIEPQQDTIVESVINQFRERSEVGIKKYGVTLDREDLSSLEWISHAQQEAMDFCLYLEKLKQTL